MKTNSSLLLCFSLSLVLISLSSCFDDNCDQRVSTQFINGNEQWVPYETGQEKVFKNEDNNTFDTLVIESFEAKTFEQQNTDDCDAVATHDLQRAELFLKSSPSTTRISLFQSSENSGLFSITHDDRELLFFYREKVFEITNEKYEYLSTDTFGGVEYKDVLRITCEDAIEPCPNYKKLFYQRGNGLIGYELNDAIWYLQ